MVLFLNMLSSAAFAEARPKHVHQDLIGEKDLLLGVKGGFVVSSLTPVTSSTTGTTTAIQAQPRARLGLSLEFIYDTPRFELGLSAVSRGGVQSGESAYGVAVPILIKLPLTLSEGGPGDVLDFEIGAGFEPRWVLSSTRPQETSQPSWVGTAGVLVDFTSFLLSVEFRYLRGLSSVQPDTNGAIAEDFELLFGYHWHE